MQVDEVRTLAVQEDRDGWSVRFPVPIVREQRLLAFLALMGAGSAFGAASVYSFRLALVCGAMALVCLGMRWTLQRSVLRAGPVVSIRSDGIRCAEGFIRAGDIRRVRVHQLGSVGTLIVETHDRRVEAARFGIGPSGVDERELDAWLIPVCAELVAPHAARRGHRSEVPRGMVALTNTNARARDHGGPEG